MLLFDKLLVGGVRFVLDKLSTVVEGELNDDTALREELLAAQMRVELGEMSQEDFEALQDEVLLRIRDIRARRGEGGPIGFSSGDGDGDEHGQEDGGALQASDLSGITADFVADDWYPESDEAEAVPAVVEGEVLEAAEQPALPAARPARSPTKRRARTAKVAAPKSKSKSKSKSPKKPKTKPVTQPKSTRRT